MSWPKLALIVIALCMGLMFGLPWVTGTRFEEWPDTLRWALVVPVLAAMVVLGRDERRREKEEDSWADDPRRTRFQNWVEKRRQRFSPERGLEFFLGGLLVFSIMIAFSAATEGIASPIGAIGFVLGFPLLAGLIGMYTEKVPL